MILARLLSRLRILRLNQLENVEINYSAKISPKAIIHVDKHSSLKIGKNVTIKPNAVIHTGPNGKIHISNNCSINYNSVLYGHFGLYIGQNTRIAANSVIIPANHKFDKNISITEQGIEGLGIYISEDVWIGANCTILDNVSIGQHSVIGAGAVVTRNIPSNSVAIGVPAKVIRKTND